MVAELAPKPDVSHDVKLRISVGDVSVTVDIGKLISQEHIQQRIIKQTVDESVPQLQEHLVEMTEVTPQDVIEDCNKDQLSNMDARTEAVEKSISQLHERVTKDTEIRSKQHSEVMTQEVMVTVVQLYPEYLDVPNANPIMQAVEKTVEVPQVQYTDRIVGVPVVTQRRVPTIQTAQGTMEVPQVQFLDRMVGVPVVTQHKTIEVPKTVSQDRIPQRTAEPVLDIPVPHAVEEIIGVFRVFVQDRVQQRMVEQTTETTAVSLEEEIMKAPKTQTQEKIICRFERGPIRVLRGMARTCVAQANPGAHR